MCVKWASVSLQIWYHCFNDYDTLFLDVYFKLRSSTELIVELNSCCYKKVDDFRAICQCIPWLLTPEKYCYCQLFPYSQRSFKPFTQNRWPTLLYCLISWAFKLIKIIYTGQLNKWALLITAYFNEPSLIFLKHFFLINFCSDPWEQYSFLEKRCTRSVRAPLFSYFTVLYFSF